MYYEKHVIIRTKLNHSLTHLHTTLLPTLLTHATLFSLFLVLPPTNTWYVMLLVSISLVAVQVKFPALLTKALVKLNPPDTLLYCSNFTLAKLPELFAKSSIEMFTAGLPTAVQLTTKFALLGNSTHRDELIVSMVALC